LVLNQIINMEKFIHTLPIIFILSYILNFSENKYILLLSKIIKVMSIIFMLIVIYIEYDILQDLYELRDI